MSDTPHDILDLLPEPHRTLAKQRRADAAREAQTPNSNIPRHLRIALASATRAFQSGDLSTLGTANEDLQPLLDAAIAWGRRQGKDAPDHLFAPVEGVAVEEVLAASSWCVTCDEPVPAEVAATHDACMDCGMTLEQPHALRVGRLAREVKRLRAEAADMQRAHSETLDYLLEQRDALILDVARLKAELDTETRRHEAATTRLSAIHDVLLSMTGASPAIADPPNVWRQFVSELADLADEGKALPLFQRLVERTAAALGLDKERLDPETGEMCLPSWHDIPEQVSKLREENARLLSIADACQHWSTRAIRAEAALEEHLASKEQVP